MTDRTPMIVLGAGGHAKVVIDLIQQIDRYQIVGLLTPDRALHGTKVMGVPVAGDDNQLGRLRSEGVQDACIAIGANGISRLRKQLFHQLRELKFNLPTLIHHRATVSTSAQIGEGAIVMAHATVNAMAVLGEDVIVNTSSVIEHDTQIGNHVHIAPSATLCGGVVVESNCLIGANAVVKELCRVGEGSIVGAGAVVVNDIPPGVVVVGVPAKIFKKQ